MKISDKEFSHLASLSRLNIEEEKREEFKSSLESVLDVINEVTKIDTSKTDKNGKAVEIDSLREDVVRPSFSREEVVANAAKSYDGAYVAPDVIE